MIAEKGGIQAVLWALLGHLDNGVVQREALVCIRNLATTSDNKKRFRDHGCEMALLLSMQANFDSPTVMDAAITAYNNVAVDIGEQTVEPVPPSVIDCVLRAMARFPQEPCVQVSACYFLKILCFHHSNIAHMQKRRDELVKRLSVAAAEYPEKCQDKTSAILSKI